MPIPKFATEGATKWDCCDYFGSNVKSALYKSGKQANEGSSMRTQWPCVINNLAEGVGVKTERKFCKEMDRMNTNLVRDIAEAKLSAKKLIRHLEKEKAAREELEDVCCDLAKEIEGRKAEIGALRNEQRRFEEEVEEERRMRQMAEVWREEQAQMKLADAKLILEDKYGEVNEVIAHLRAFLTRSNVCGVMIPESDKAEWRNDEADCAAIVHFISNEFKDASTRKMSERSVRRACMSERKGSKPGLDARTNPHVVRAMTGHNQWPWRIQRQGLAGNLLEAKLESQKMLLRNVLKQKT